MNHLLYLHCSDQNVRTIKSQFCLTSVAHATVGKRYTDFRYTVCFTLAHKLSNETNFDKVNLRQAARSQRSRNLSRYCPYKLREEQLSIPHTKTKKNHSRYLINYN